MKLEKMAKKLVTLVLCMSLLTGLIPGTLAEGGENGAYTIVSDETVISLLSETSTGEKTGEFRVNYNDNDYLQPTVTLQTTTGEDLTNGQWPNGTKANLNIAIGFDNQKLRDAFKEMNETTHVIFQIPLGTSLPDFTGMSIPTKDNPNSAYASQDPNTPIFKWWTEKDDVGNIVICLEFTDEYYNSTVDYSNAFVAMSGELNFTGDNEDNKEEYQILGSPYTITFKPNPSIAKSAGNVHYDETQKAFVADYTLTITTDMTTKNIEILEKPGSWIGEPIEGTVSLNKDGILVSGVKYNYDYAQKTFTIDKLSKGTYTLTYSAKLAENDLSEAFFGKDGSIGMSSWETLDKRKNTVDMTWGYDEKKSADATVSYADSPKINKQDNGGIQSETRTDPNTGVSKTYYYVEYSIDFSVNVPAQSVTITDTAPKYIKPDTDSFKLTYNNQTKVLAVTTTQEGDSTITKIANVTPIEGNTFEPGRTYRITYKAEVDYDGASKDKVTELTNTACLTSIKLNDKDYTINRSDSATVTVTQPSIQKTSTGSEFVTVDNKTYVRYGWTVTFFYPSATTGTQFVDTVSGTGHYIDSTGFVIKNNNKEIYNGDAADIIELSENNTKFTYTLGTIGNEEDIGKTYQISYYTLAPYDNVKNSADGYSNVAGIGDIDTDTVPIIPGTSIPELVTHKGVDIVPNPNVQDYYDWYIDVKFPKPVYSLTVTDSLRVFDDGEYHSEIDPDSVEFYHINANGTQGNVLTSEELQGVNYFFNDGDLKHTLTVTFPKDWGTDVRIRYTVKNYTLCKDQENNDIITRFYNDVIYQYKWFETDEDYQKPEEEYVTRYPAKNPKIEKLAHYENGTKENVLMWKLSLSQLAAVNKTENAVNNLTIVDTLPVELEYIPNSMRWCKNGDWQKQSFGDEGHVVYDADQHTLTITLPDECWNAIKEINSDSDTLDLYFDTKPTKAYITEAVGKNEQKELENKVSLQKDKTEISNSSASQWLTVADNRLNKTHSIGENNTITYTVSVNTDELKLSDNGYLILRDELPAQLVLKYASVQVTDANGNALTQVNDLASVMAGGGYMVGLDNKGNLEVTVPDQKSLLLTYDTVLQGEVGDEYTDLVNKVSLNGEHISKTDKIDEIKVETSSEGITIEAGRGILLLEKFGNGKLLSGAEYTVYKVDTNGTLVEALGEPKATVNGSVQFSFSSELAEPVDGVGVFHQVYCLKETKAPDTYTLPDDADNEFYFYFYLLPKDYTNMKTEHPELYATLQALETMGKTVTPNRSLIHIQRENHRSSFELSLKLEKNFDASYTEAAGPARFMLYKVQNNGDDLENGKRVGDEISISADGGSVTVSLGDSGAAEGWYLLTETKSPTGFEAMQDLYFYVEGVWKDDTPTCVVALPADTTRTDVTVGRDAADSKIGLVTATNYKNTTGGTFSKKAIAGTLELPGAHLALYVYDDEKPDGNGDLVEQWDSTETAHELENEVLTAGQTYQLVETTAPYGYAIAESIRFTVQKNTDGSFSFSLAEMGNGEVSNGTTLTMRDQPVELSVAKADTEGNPVSGAELTVTDTTTGITIPDGQKALSWTTDGSAHPLNAVLTANHTYKLEETKTPAGYITAAPVYFMVDSDGKIYQTDSDYNKQQPETAVTAITMVDVPFTVIVDKKDKAEEPATRLEGAELAIYKGSTYSEAAELVATLEWNRDAQRYVLKENVKLSYGETYVIHEKTAPAGYALAADTTFTINAEAINGAAGTALKTITISIIDDPITVTFEKLDAESKLLPGATLVLKDEEDNVIDRWTTDAEDTTTNPHILTAKLEAGKTYTLSEENAPETYQVAPAITFTVGADGKLTLPDNTPINNNLVLMTDTKIGQVSLTVSKQWNDRNLTNVSHPAITLQLVRKLATAGENDPYEAVSGKTLTLPITGENDQQLWTGTFSNLEKINQAGTRYLYSVQEVTVPGYSKHELQVTEEGDNFIVNLTNYADSIEGTFSKQDITGGAELPGATLTLTDVTNGGNVAVAQWESGEQPTTLKDDLLTIGHTYKLTEEIAPDGYALAAESIVFTVVEAADHSVSFRMDSGNTVGEVNGTTVTMKDQPLDVSILKVDANNVPIAGARLELYEGNAIDPEKLLIKVTSGTEAISIRGLMDSGYLFKRGASYTLHEVTPPDGYAAAADVHFTFVNDTQVNIQSVVMRDMKLELAVQKLDDGGNLLPGAVLALYEEGADQPLSTWNTADYPIWYAAKDGGLSLVYGRTYILREVSAPGGYILMADQKITLNQAALAQGSSADAMTATLTAVNRKNTVSILKVAKESGQPLAGATLRLQRLAADGTATETIQEWVTGTTPQVIAGKLTVGETYLVTEVSAPAGYTVAKPYRFVMKDTYTADQPLVITLEDPRIFRFAKRNPDGQYVEGATLSIYNSAGQVIDTWITGAADHEVADLLVRGQTYTLREDRTPYGYLTADPITFTVNANGLLSIGGNQADLITMIDDYIPTVTPTPAVTPGPEMDLTVTKRWSDSNDAMGMRPEQIVLHLYRKLVTDASYPSTPYLTVTVTPQNKASNTWRFTFEDLERYNQNRVNYQYMVEEEAVGGYTVRYTNNGQSITNAIPDEDIKPTPTPTLPYVTPTPGPQQTVPAGVRFIDGEWVYIDENGVPLGIVPQTGDDTNWLLLGAAILLPLILAALAAIELRRRKKRGSRG